VSGTRRRLATSQRPTRQPPVRPTPTTIKPLDTHLTTGW
jgi:hypothetical protein